MNHNEILSNLLTELDSIDNSNITKERFTEFIQELKNKTSELILTKQVNDLNNQILRLKNFKPLSNTSFFSRFFHRFAAIKYNTHTNDDWHKNGKYEYDLNRIKLLLEGLIFRLEQTSSS